jgi:signal transduction histidine kinase
MLVLSGQAQRGEMPSDLSVSIKRMIGHATGARLGLAIVKGIIESHGGKIWAKSVLGKGTSFFFTIPKTEMDEVIQSS